MCVEWTGGWRVTTRSIIAYKVARQDCNLVKGEVQYLSPVQIRKPQTEKINNGRQLKNARMLGGVLSYMIGGVINSGNPGIYLYRSRGDAEVILGRLPGCHILKMRIPKGTLIRFSRSQNPVSPTPLQCINARQVKVLSVMKAESNFVMSFYT